MARATWLDGDESTWLERPSFSWGETSNIGSAAYWVDQLRRTPPTEEFRLGSTLAEEIAACMLGGYGMPAELGLAAFEAVRAAGLLASPPLREDLELVLLAPLPVAGRLVRYRFPRQRAARIATALGQLSLINENQHPRSLRDALVGLPGIGYKTASWIVRNHTGTDEVAIIDIHIRRAGVAAGFFPVRWHLPHDYARFEAAFLTFAAEAQVSAARLDACIWSQLHELGEHGPTLLAAAQRARLAREEGETYLRLPTTTAPMS